MLKQVANHNGRKVSQTHVVMDTTCFLANPVPLHYLLAWAYHFYMMKDLMAWWWHFMLNTDLRFFSWREGTDRCLLPMKKLKIFMALVVLDNYSERGGPRPGCCSQLSSSWWTHNFIGPQESANYHFISQLYVQWLSVINGSYWCFLQLYNS